VLEAEGLLQRMQCLTKGQAFHGGNLGTIGLYG
jgi:hypothetical protein